jgi:4-aminobutyrate aminotransferase
MIPGLAPVLPHITDIVAVKGHGAYLYDTRGRRYLDFTSGIGVTNTGHCHPRVVDAIREQAGRLLHAQINVVYQEPMIALIGELRRVVPEGLNTFFFANSGAEAVEASVKLARRATGRPNVIVFQGGFHGRTLGAVSLTTSKRVVRAGYQPLMAGVFPAPFPYAYRYGWSPDATLAWCLTELRHLLETQTAPEDTAAMLVEPVLGEGGYVVPPAGFLPALREICDAHGILLITDEVQTGFGRTGRFFAVEHTETRPDILVMAKAMASGLPLSAIAAGEELMARWPAGSHGTTFGGNVLSCAAAVATIGVLRDEKLIEHAAGLGERLMARLQTVQHGHPAMGDLRGLGLMVGIEFRDAGDVSAGELAKRVQRACLERGLLLLTCGYREHVVRWLPPLVATGDEIDEAVGIFADALGSVPAVGERGRA